MDLLVTLKKDKTTTGMTLQPLVRSKRVNRIYVVRDHPGAKLPKVKYYCLPKILTKSGVIKTVAKLVLMMYLTAIKKPQAILSFQSFPHGFNAFICGKIFRKPINVNIMGSPRNWRGRRKLIPLLRRFNAISVTGTKSREYLIKQGFDADKVYILPDAIDMERFRPTPVTKRYDVVTVTRLSPEKNLEVLLKAAAMVKTNKGDLKVGILGNGSTKDSLELLSRRLDIKKNVEFIGFKQNTDFYYNSSRLYVLTSTTEGLPMALLEAMACGLPPIVSNVGDISDAARDGFNAIVVDNPNDVNAFADAITKLLKDDVLRQTFSQNALKVRQDYCYERATEVWERIFDSLNLN